MTGPADAPPGGAAELAERFGSPLYVIDARRAARAAREFRGAWGPDVAVAYSLKCNPLLGVVRTMHAEGCLAEAASGFEYRIARRAGVPGDEIVFNGPLKRADELRRALIEGATIVLDGPEQVRACARLAGIAGETARVGLRLTPPDRRGSDRFGLPDRMVPVAARMLARAGLPVTGLHVHLGAYQLGPLPPSGPPIHSVTVQYPLPVERFARAAAHLRDTAERLGGIEWLDLGGGWPAAPGLAPYVDAVRAAVGARGPRLLVEPGRALVRDAGWLLARVVERRGSGAVVLDVGVTQVPCVMWKRSPVHPVAPRTGAIRDTDLFGPLCLQHDAVAREVPLPPLAVGDLVWIGQAGAYGIAQASPFIHPRPGAILVDGEHATVLRVPADDEEELAPQAEPLLVGPGPRTVLT